MAGKLGQELQKASHITSHPQPSAKNNESIYAHLLAYSMFAQFNVCTALELRFPCLGNGTACSELGLDSLVNLNKAILNGHACSATQCR